MSPDPDTHPKYALNHKLLGEKPLTKMGLKLPICSRFCGLMKNLKVL
jgi:hypothetical protein